MSDWSGTRVLVTGAGGFIGSHLVERLVALGAKTRALVRYRSNGSWGWLDASPVKGDIDVVAGDVCDRESVRDAMEGIEIVFHLAALIAIPYSYQVPSAFVRTNVMGTLNVLQAAQAVGVARLVHTSTSEVYGTARQVPIDEQHPLQAQSPYAASKIAADKLAESFGLSFDLPVVTVRPFNTFGPRQSARAIVPTIITQCLTDTKVRVGNLTPTRDLNYVSDTVEGFVRAAMSSRAVGRTIHLGSGRETSVGELVRLIAELSEKPVELEQEPVRMRPQRSEVERLVADHRLANDLLEWQPTVSLEEGLRLTIEWMREHLDAYRPGVYVV
ncbi:MAG: SDR family NAD(P)-dependent oxidoreductase [Candidatus Omnitrophica bacterium]|nr:SDR family NAD(P)-dependent oxidoreductase [Candidatus Omnitrophota bacterium]